MTKCPSCRTDKKSALVCYFQRDDEETVFGGYVCSCGHRFWHANPVGREITEIEWRRGRLSQDLGFDVNGGMGLKK